MVRGGFVCALAALSAASAGCRRTVTDQVLVGTVDVRPGTPSFSELTATLSALGPDGGSGTTATATIPVKAVSSSMQFALTFAPGHTGRYRLHVIAWEGTTDVAEGTVSGQLTGDVTNAPAITFGAAADAGADGRPADAGPARDATSQDSRLSSPFDMLPQPHDSWTPPPFPEAGPAMGDGGGVPCGARNCTGTSAHCCVCLGAGMPTAYYCVQFCFDCASDCPSTTACGP